MQTLLDRESDAFLHTYKRIPLEIVGGSGMEIITRDGTRYLDMVAGVAVNALGYGHPGLLTAIRTQAERYIHLSNYFLQEPQIELAEMLVRSTGFPKVFFANTGTETVEAALKLARRWGAPLGKPEIVSLSNAFHGRTMGALSLMDRAKYREGFGPFLPQCIVVEHNDAQSLEQAVNARTAAVILEFIQGEGGIRPVSPAFTDTLRNLQRELGFLIIADEIQSGAGRTGKFFAFQHYDLEPDIALMAKPLGGGLPLGAVLCATRVADVLKPGSHGTTFGGNPVACAAGIVVIRAITEGGLMENASAMGSFFQDGLRQLQQEFPALVKEVRGAGLMIGMELTQDGEPVVEALRARKILINCTDQIVLRFIPPLIVQRPHIQKTLDALREVFRATAR